MLRRIVSSPYLNTLENALAASSTRHKVISDNIANVNTPGFKKSEVDFESKLAAAMDESKKRDIMALTHEKHLPAKFTLHVSPEIRRSDDTTMRLDGNNVDIDSEMASLAKNNIYYNTVVQRVQGYFNNIKTCLTGGR